MVAGRAGEGHNSTAGGEHHRFPEGSGVKGSRTQGDPPSPGGILNHIDRSVAKTVI
jgi:hypothetical protein